MNTSKMRFFRPKHFQRIAGALVRRCERHYNTANSEYRVFYQLLAQELVKAIEAENKTEPLERLIELLVDKNNIFPLSLSSTASHYDFLTQAIHEVRQLCAKWAVTGNIVDTAPLNTIEIVEEKTAPTIKTPSPHIEVKFVTKVRQTHLSFSRTSKKQAWEWAFKVAQKAGEPVYITEDRDSHLEVKKRQMLDQTRPYWFILGNGEVYNVSPAC